MIRFSSVFSIKRSILVSLLLVLVLLSFAACEDVSPALGKYYSGRTLHVSVVAMERVPELRYSVPGVDGVPAHYRIAPEEPDNELAMLRIKVENHTATSAIVSIDQSAAELRDFFHDKYFPVDVKERPEEVGAPADPGDERIARCPFQHPADLCFLWNETVTGGETRAFELKKGFGIDGWLLFEVPQDAEIRELRWRAGDGLSIEF